MKLDFWQLSRDPVEAVVARIAPRVLDGGDRLLVVDGDAERRAAISRALWAEGGFLANGEDHAARQPILLSGECTAANGARTAVFADGTWREEGAGFERTFLLFTAAQVAAARTVWRQFDGRDDVTRSYFEQDGGKWVKRA
ncbi:DNA polymerase III subunit chi [Tsuneonella amylolytica]|uniref:DNA polymerase III subunit chi n=1 Tax=Tsuneonella amylolytica TaxID=2338327 RepID=UPI000EA8EB41|nr:DNA polymerase III subunit chi [Tsuneonella amylolytica]